MIRNKRQYQEMLDEKAWLANRIATFDDTAQERIGMQPRVVQEIRDEMVQWLDGLNADLRLYEERNPG